MLLRVKIGLAFAALLVVVSAPQMSLAVHYADFVQSYASGGGTADYDNPNVALRTGAHDRRRGLPGPG